MEKTDQIKTNKAHVKPFLFLNFFLFAMLLNSVGIVILKAQKVYGINPLQASAIEAFKDLPIAIAAFFVASIISRIGYKTSMLIALGLITLSQLLLYYGNSYYLVLVLFASIGFSFALIKISVYTLIGLVSETKNEHASLLSWVEAIFSFGVVFMFLFFPFFNNPDVEDAWLNAYLVLSLLSIILFFWLLVTPFNLKTPQIDTSYLKEFKRFVILNRNIVVVIFLLSTFFFVAIEQGVMSWLPTFNNLGAQLQENLAILTAGSFTLSIAIGRVVNSFVVKKYNPFSILFTCIILSEFIIYYGIPVTLSVDLEGVNSLFDIPLKFYTFSLVGFFLAPIYPNLNSVILSSTPVSLHSHMTGLIIIFSAVGGTLGSRFVGYLTNEFGVIYAFDRMFIPIAMLFLCVLMLKVLTTDTDDITEEYNFE